MNHILLTSAAGQTLTIGRYPPILLTSMEGAEGYQASINAETNAQMDGSSYVGSRVQARNILINLLIVQDTEANRHRLQRLLPPHEEGTLTCVGETSRQIRYRVESLTFPHTTARRKTAALSLLCPNPFFQDTEEFSSNIAGKRALLTLPFCIPPGGTVFSRRLFDPEEPLLNPGDKEAGLIIEFVANGPVRNPRIDNLTTGQYLRVVTSLAQGDRLVINTCAGSKRIELNGENINHRIDRGSDFFSLLPGENLLRYSSEEGYEDLDVFLRWRAEYWGA